MVKLLFVITVIEFMVINTQTESYLIRLTLPLIVYMIGYLLGDIAHDEDFKE